MAERSGRRWWAAGAPRAVLIAVAYAAAWTGLDFAATAFEVRPGVSVWYPPAALNYVLLFVLGLRYWPLLLSNAPLHALLVDRESTAGLLDLALDAAITTGGYAGAAAVLLRVVRIDPGLGRLRDVAWFVGLAALAGPFAISAMQVANMTLFGDAKASDAVVNVLSFLAGDATGTGMLAPFLLVALRRYPRLWAEPPRRPPPGLGPAPGFLPARDEWPWVAGEWPALAGGVWLAYGTGRVPGLDYTYLVSVPMVWIALRNGFPRATLAVLAVNVAIAVMVKAKLGAVASLALQFGLMTLTLTGLLLGAVSTEVRRAAARLRHEATHDALTGLPNRRLFAQRLTRAARAAARDRRRLFAVLLVDLDRFKAVNDKLGHAAGDRLLAETGGRIAASVRPADTAARLGGDEFAVLLDGQGGEAEAVRVAERLLGACAAPFGVEGREARLGASVGVALGGEGARASSANELMRNADAALFQAKARGGGCYAVFDRAMHARALERLELEADLRRALEAGDAGGDAGGGGFALHFQPLVSLGDGAVIGAEALARWRHPRHGWVPPDAFVPLAEETGLIHPLGRWALREACAQARAWLGEGRRLSMAVNVSTRQLQQPGFAQGVLDALAGAGLEPGVLELELTEGVLLERTERVAQTLAHLAGAGVAIAIDDFGTGYSSLGYLKHLPVRGLKIDRTFVRDLPGDAGSEAIVEAILALSARMGLAVTAEGVETEEQAAFLRERGCGRAQGFLFGRPAPAAEFPAAGG